MNKKYRSSILIFFIIANLSLLQGVHARWKGPETLVSGKWGADTGEFFFIPQDIVDSFPRKFGVDEDGNIIISDEGNKRIYIYRSNGDLIKIIKKPPKLPETEIVFGYWPVGFLLFKYKKYITFNCDQKEMKGGYHSDTRCFMDYNGIILNKIDSTEIFPTSDGYFLKRNNGYEFYTYNGQLIKIYSSRPLELGIVNTKSLANRRYKTTIKYPDITYTINRHFHRYYFRGCNNMLFGTSNNQVQMIDHNGKLIAEFNMPKDKRKILRPAGGGFEEYSEVIEQYGEPLIETNGDIYCWKRTPDKYSIIKWTWYDGENSPIKLKALAEKKGVRLSWQKPEVEAETVKKYEIARSEEICGPFNPVANVGKNAFNFTDRDTKKGQLYFYKIRGLRDNGYTSYSNKVGVRNEVQKIRAEYIETDDYLKVEKKILSGELIISDELKPFSNIQLKLLRNTVFAKYGREFKSEMISTWFNEKPWYKVNKKYSDNLIKNNDKKNVSIIYGAEHKN